MRDRALTATIVNKKIERPRIDLSYPVVTGLPNPIVEQRINLMIQDQIYQLFRQEGYVEDRTKSFWGTYKIRANKNGVLSLSIELYDYAKGAAHGMTFLKSQTFDLHTGKMYSFLELFKKGSNYQQIITDIVKREIKGKDIPLIADYNGVTDEQEYYLTDQTLVVYYQLYEYTPYAYGIPEFPIPYTALQSVVNPLGPIPKLMTR